MDVVSHPILVAVDAELDRRDRYGYDVPDPRTDGQWLAVATEELGRLARLLVDRPVTAVAESEPTLFLHLQHLCGLLAAWLASIEARRGHRP